jgi:hypothetical protein
METLITRDTDILREYLAALDATERGVSPFARLAATVKLARLRRELRAVQLETTDEDIARLRSEVDERLDRTWVRRLISGHWGSRLAGFLIIVGGQQLALLLVLLAAALFLALVPPAAGWNPAYPNDQPGFLFLFIFLSFFMTPMLALAVLFGGRYFRSWRVTIPTTLAILILSVVATVMVDRKNPNKPNPAGRHSSLTLFAPERGVNVKSYREWVGMNWLMNDPKFQADYESYLRKGPGRWIASGLKNDAAWHASLTTMSEYLDGGQDPASFREWLTDYLSRNRIYSEDRIPQEVSVITGEANERFLGVWQVEPYLMERDERIYRAYLGSINSSMKRWGLLGLALYTIAFLLFYLIGPALTGVNQAFGRVRSRGRAGGGFGVDGPDPREAQGPGKVTRLTERYNSFPERSQITTPPFFDAPFKLLSRVHRSFVGFAVFSSVVAFAFWAAVYGVDLASGQENASTQTALMRSNLLFSGPPSQSRYDGSAQASALTGDRRFSYDDSTGRYALSVDAPFGTAQVSVGRETDEDVMAARILELQRRLEDDDYESSKKFKEQTRTIAGQRQEIDLLRRLSSQLQQTTSELPTQVADLSTRTTAAEARAGEVLGEAGSAKQKADNIEKQLTAKIGEVETRTTRATEQIGRVQDQTSVLATRTEDLEKELDRRTSQVEARTEELGERTAGLKEREARVDRLQVIAFAAIVSSISSAVDDLDRRIESAFYRLFSKGEAQRDIDSLRRRIVQLSGELRDANIDQTKDLVRQLGDLSKRVDEISARVK